jgi:hypothetical protein
LSIGRSEPVAFHPQHCFAIDRCSRSSGQSAICGEGNGRKDRELAQLQFVAKHWKNNAAPCNGLRSTKHANHFHAQQDDSGMELLDGAVFVKPLPL